MRIASIDLVRGVAMVLMAIDHAREYSSGPGRVADPMQLDQVTPLLYALRWASHFCAPVFALLMGVSAGLQPRPRHLLLRGLLLVLLEFTIVDWSWTFYPLWPRKFWQVIAALGCASIVLGALIPLGRGAVLSIGAAIVGFHNLMDGVSFAEGSPAHYGWSLLHQKNVLPLWGGFEVRTTYPVLPVVGVALLGFGLAGWFQREDAAKRLATAGAGFVVLFLVLRIVTGYGDASVFSWRQGGLRSLGNVTKYPLSLQFVLMTLGPALLALAALHRRERGPAWLLALGRAPLFFYVAHLYALHAIALLWALAEGHALPGFSRRFGGMPESFGFPLWMTLPFALGTTALLVPACVWYASLRKRHPKSLLRYL